MGTFASFQPELLFPAFVAYSSSVARDKLSRECRAKVVEWRWASGDMAFASRQPFVKERYRQEPKWLGNNAKPRTRDLRHGLDGEGNIHVVEEILGKNRISPTYILYDDDRIDSIAYRTPGSLELVRRRLYDGPLLQREIFFGGRHGSDNLYQWNDDRLNRILALGWQHDRVSKEAATFSGFEETSVTEQLYEYDSLGRLDRIVERSLNADGSLYEGLPPRIEYQRPKKNESIPQLAKAIEQLLMKQIPAGVAKATGKGPFYCLLLCYCEEDFGAGWPPTALLRTEAERQQIIEGGNDVKYFVWAPDEAEDTGLWVSYRDETLSAHCELHNQLMDVKDDHSSAKKALHNVAKALNEFDWTKVIEVTPDFVVAALDNTGEVEFTKDLKASIPAQRFRLLKQRGLV